MINDLEKNFKEADVVYKGLIKCLNRGSIGLRIVLID